MSNIASAVQDRTNEAVRFVNSGFVSLLDTKPMRPVFDALAEPYLAGHSFQEGIDEGIRIFDEQGVLSTFDILGELDRKSMTEEEFRSAYPALADRMYQGNLDLLDLMAQRMDGTGASLSTKLTSISAVEKTVGDKVKLNNGRPAFFNKNQPLIRLEAIVAKAENLGIDVTLDMEESTLTDTTLLYADHLWSRGYSNLGIVLQAGLNRTRTDVQNLFGSGRNSEKRVRLVRGIYIEPRDISVGKTEAKSRIVDRAQELFEAGVYVEFGTHDLQILDRIMKEVILEMGITPSMCEFQFLRGVYNGEVAGRRLRGEGFTTRYYMPVEERAGDGHPYMVRRLKANPQIALAGAKNVAQKMFYSGNGRPK